MKNITRPIRWLLLFFVFFTVVSVIDIVILSRADNITVNMYSDTASNSLIALTLLVLIIRNFKSTFMSVLFFGITSFYLVNFVRFIVELILDFEVNNTSGHKISTVLYGIALVYFANLYDKTKQEEERETA